MWKKDLDFYMSRWSRHSSKIVKLVIKIESYLPKANKKCDNRDFLEDASNAFRSVLGNAGDAAWKVHREIDKHIETMQLFLRKWEKSSGIDKKVVSFGKDLHDELTRLKSLLETDIPPEVRGEAKEARRAIRNASIKVFGCPPESLPQWDPPEETGRASPGSKPQ